MYIAIARNPSTPFISLNEAFQRQVSIDFIRAAER